jgi:cytochrome c5
MRTILAGVIVTAIGAGASSALPRQQADEPLPDGDGKKILQASCTACHDLKEVTKFRGFYTRPDWQDIVATMIQYGAKVEDKDVDVLVDYLARVLGKPSEAPR